MSVYVGGAVAISLFSKLSVYAGGVAGNVDLCGVNFVFFKNLDLCGGCRSNFSTYVVSVFFYFLQSSS